ncbi:MAG: hemolysin family protein [Gammaproteobacteria bacterium]|nr:hemolysin family protein [Gammaproteobacteria bacterium]NND61401.1 HlyC/CorC family transporter [Gammaproteobacteria bacterium]
MLIFITAVAIVLVVSFVCSIFESVLLSLSRPRIELMMQKGSRAGHLLSGFRRNMDVPISAILILNTAAHTVGASVAGASYSSVFADNTLWVFSILFTIAVLLFTEIIPKTLGVAYATVLAVPVAHGIQWLTRVLRPFVWLSEKVSRAVRGDLEMPVTSADEIRLLASLGRSEGVVGARTAGIIVGATQLRHLQAHDVMLPREQVRFLSGDMSREQVVDFMREAGHSRFPFTATGDLDQVSGMVLAKELLDWLLRNPDVDIDWEAVAHESLVIPRSVSVPQMLKTFQDSRRHQAIVVDEYGSVMGIATFEDVLEEIVGEIYDESDSPVRDFEETDDGKLIVRAAVDLRKLSSRLGLHWEADTEVSSIGGLVSEELERVPMVGDTISWNGFRIEVLRADRRRARLLSIHPE